MIEMADEGDQQDPLDIANVLVKDEDLSLFEVNDNDREEAFGIFDDELESSSTSAVNDPPEVDSVMNTQSPIHSESAATSSAATTGIANNDTPLATDTQQTIENAANNESVSEATNTNASKILPNSESIATTSGTADVDENGTQYVALATDTQTTIENAADDESVTEAESQSLPHSEPIASTSAAATGAGTSGIALAVDDDDEGFFAVEQFPMPLMSVRHGIIKHENDDVSGRLAYKETVYCTIHFTLKSPILTFNIYYRRKAAAMK